jgi:hypothetical protein
MSPETRLTNGRTCLRVCKSWKVYLSSSSRLWTTIDLNHGSATTQRRIPSQSVKNYIRNSQYALQTAKLGCFQHRPTLLALVKCCKALKTLEFPNGSELGGDSVIAAVRNAKALQILTVGFSLAPDQVPQILRERATLIEIHLTNISRGIWRELEVDMFHLTTLSLCANVLDFQEESPQVWIPCASV